MVYLVRLVPSRAQTNGTNADELVFDKEIQNPAVGTAVNKCVSNPWVSVFG